MAELLSHLGASDVELGAAIAAARARIESAPPEMGSHDELHELLDHWVDCDLGRWMLVHRGWNAYWTRYCISYPERIASGEPIPSNPVERFFLSRSVQVVATQQRFAHFTSLLGTLLTPGVSALSVPCGVMDDLLTAPGAEQCGALVGADLDPASIELAMVNSQQRGLADRAIFVEADAWQLADPHAVRGDAERFAALCNAGFDVVTSNGLNIYVAEDGDVVALYRSFASVMSNGGHLVVSALTPPDSWDLSGVDPADVLTTRQLTFINDVKWANPRTVELTIAQLESASLEVTDVLYDNARAFPTFLAIRR